MQGYRRRVHKVKQDHQVLKREAIEYVLDEFGSYVKGVFANLSNQMDARAQAKARRGAAAAGIDYH
jgi:hypothetical protein